MTRQVKEHLAPSATRSGSSLAPRLQYGTRSSRRSIHGSNPAPTGAIIVGGDYQGLGIVRSLGRNKIPLCVVDDEFSVGRFSRYSTYSLRVRHLRDDESLLESIFEAHRRFGLEGWVLYPTRDETVAALARHRAELSQHFRVPTPSWETTMWAWDKAYTYRLAKSVGIPVPRTWAVVEPSDAETIDTAGPFAIKPAVKEDFYYATGAKAWRAEDHNALVSLLPKAAALAGPAGLVIQELIPGEGDKQFAYCAFFKEGRSVSGMAVCRRRQHPPEFGRASTYVETVDVPILKSLSERFLRAIDYYGLVELEYKLDGRDGLFKLLDVNARTWGYHSVAQRAGIDFPYLLFADQVGREVHAGQARAGVGWVHLVTDLPTGALEIYRRRLRLTDYVKSLARCSVEASFAFDDPLPGLMEVALVPYLAVKRGF